MGHGREVYFWIAISPLPGYPQFLPLDKIFLSLKKYAVLRVERTSPDRCHVPCLFSRVSSIAQFPILGFDKFYELWHSRRVLLTGSFLDPWQTSSPSNRHRIHNYASARNADR